MFKFDVRIHICVHQETRYKIVTKKSKIFGIHKHENISLQRYLSGYICISTHHPHKKHTYKAVLYGISLSFSISAIFMKMELSCLRLFENFKVKEILKSLKCNGSLSIVGNIMLRQQLCQQLCCSE